VLSDILSRNLRWSEPRAAEEPGYFARLAALQAPEFFWIGCSDSRVPANIVAGLNPGEVFVHRNLANVVHSSEVNLLSTLEFAIEALKVREIIVCGHYGCGGVKAATEDLPHGLTDHWLEPIRRLARAYAVDLARAPTPKCRSVEWGVSLRDRVDDPLRHVASIYFRRRGWL
jgi:carbonic anhydrase